MHYRLLRNSPSGKINQETLNIESLCKKLTIEVLKYEGIVRNTQQSTWNSENGCNSGGDKYESMDL